LKAVISTENMVIENRKKWTYRTMYINVYNHTQYNLLRTFITW